MHHQLNTKMFRTGQGTGQNSFGVVRTGATSLFSRAQGGLMALSAATPGVAADDEEREPAHTGANCRFYGSHDLIERTDSARRKASVSGIDIRRRRGASIKTWLKTAPHTCQSLKGLQLYTGPFTHTSRSWCCSAFLHLD